ncbi:MAG: histone deacetylase [Polynucleobacter sp.]|nr:histone deacetylase [Polynucleobacter sp.]MDZ4055524.1 histone deacetylase [Polynucleobacter sp.]
MTVKAFYTDHFVLPLPEGHRFPMQKYRMLRAAISAIPAIELHEAPAASDTQLLYAHDPSYIQKVLLGQLSPQEQRDIGFPWSKRMVERSRRSAGATIAACEAALVDGVAVNLAGGTHHAYRNQGSGFCVFNDAAIAARTLQKTCGAQFRVAIVDLDVHQGNGTAAILKQDERIFTLSLHGENNYPFDKESSDLDVALPDGCGDTHYLNALERALIQLQDQFNPQFIIYLAGADPHENDRLGKLRLSKAGMLARDQMVYAFAQNQSAPVAIAMAGGYGKDIELTVEIHAQTIEAALCLDQRDSHIAR